MLAYTPKRIHTSNKSIYSTKKTLNTFILVVVNHLGMELNVISRLVGLIWSGDSPEMAAPPNLQPCTQTNLSQWFYQTDTNLYWTKQRLVQLALR